MYRIEYLDADKNVIRVAYETGIYDSIKHISGKGTSVTPAFEKRPAVSIQWFKAKKADDDGWQKAVNDGLFSRAFYYHFDWQYWQ